MLTVVSGQTVVHSESTKARTTTLPRNWLSDMGWPNWLTSRMSGAARLPSEVPGSRSGLAAAACACAPPIGPIPGAVAVLPALAPQAARASSPAIAPARSSIRPAGFARAHGSHPATGGVAFCRRADIRIRQWVMSIRRGCTFGEAGMVTCSTPSA